MAEEIERDLLARVGVETEPAAAGEPTAAASVGSGSMAAAAAPAAVGSAG